MINSAESAGNKAQITSGFGLKGHTFIMFNFCIFSLLFSANHGTVVSLVALASTVNKDQSGLQNGVFYGTYTLSSLLFANLFVTKFGAKGAILLGMTTYCFYSLCFLIMHYLDESQVGLKTFLVVFSSTLSGVGAGGLWTAQASFFSESAKKHAAITGQTVEKVTGLYATVFPCFYLSMELLMRILSSVIKFEAPVNGTKQEKDAAENNKVMLFSIYSSVAVVCTILMLVLVTPMKTKVARVPIFEKITGMFMLMCKDPRVLLLAPYNFTFSFASSFLNEYLNANIVASSNVGWFGAGLVGSAIFASTFFGALIKRTGLTKVVPMLAGSFSFLGFILFMFIFTNEQLYNNFEYLVPIYVLFGVGRGIWESTMKAVFADYFGDLPQPAAAFASIPFQNGFAGAAGFIIFGNIKSDAAARDVGKYFVAAIGIAGIICYLIADQINRANKRGKAKADQASLLSSQGANGENGTFTKN